MRQRKVAQDQPKSGGGGGGSSSDEYEFGKEAKEKKLKPLFTTIVVLGGALVLVDRTYTLSFDVKINSLLLISLVAIIIMFVTSDPIPQAQAYHNFADQRCLVCCVPNSFDVLSNIPFALVSAFGLDHVYNGSEGIVSKLLKVPPPMFIAPEKEKPLWILYFIGVGLVSIGSGYYHWRPTDARLVWDRLPMTICFMAVLASIIEETTNMVSPLLVVSLVTFGAGSVFYWSVTDDLRPYALVQFYSLALIPLLMLLFPTNYEGAMPNYMLSLLFYVAAKITEAKDKQIFRATGKLVSGHTIKHLLAGVATSLASVILMKRTARVQ
jgi:hypothetical protein